MIGLKAVDLKTQKIETLVLPVCADRKIHDDRALSAVIQKALKLKEFKADKEERVTLFDVKGIAADRVMCVGLGKLNKIDLDVLRSFCGSAVGKCIQSGFETIWVAVPPRARFLRIIWSELHRLHSHLLWLGLFADSFGFESLFMQFWKIREKVLDLNEATSGNRIIVAVNAIGGVRRDLSIEQLNWILAGEASKAR